MRHMLTFLAATGATWFFAILFRAPRKSQAVAALLGGCAYMISEFLGGLTGVFLGALFLTLGGEMAARLMKVTATAFIMTALVALVPGVGMYESMLLFVQNDVPAALARGLDTVAQAGAIAGAVALGSSFMRMFTLRPHADDASRRP